MSRPEARTLSSTAAVLLALSLPSAAGADGPIPAGAPPAPAAPTPFAALVDRVHAAVPVAIGSIGVVPLWALPDAARGALGPRSWVGLEGTGATGLQLPHPVGLRA